MRLVVPLLAAIGLIGLAAAPALAAQAQVDTQFTFTGTCTDCQGVGTGTLTVENYTLGAAFSVSNFVDFTYTSNIFPAAAPFEITAATVESFSGSVGPALPGPFTVDIFSSMAFGAFFSEQSDGDGGSPWCIGAACSADYGPTHTWSVASSMPVPVPEPVSALLFATGVAALGLVRSRRR